MGGDGGWRGVEAGKMGKAGAPMETWTLEDSEQESKEKSGVRERSKEIWVWPTRERLMGRHRGRERWGYLRLPPMGWRRQGRVRRVSSRHTSRNRWPQTFVEEGKVSTKVRDVHK